MFSPRRIDDEFKGGGGYRTIGKDLQDVRKNWGSFVTGNFVLDGLECTDGHPASVGGVVF